MREAAGEFAPCGHTLGLQHVFPCFDELLSHPIEVGCELPDVVARFHRGPRTPVAACHLPHRRCELPDRLGDAPGRPETQAMPAITPASATKERSAMD